MLRPKFLFFLCLVLSVAASAKDSVNQEIVWPSDGAPVLRFTFGKFKEADSSGKQRVYNVDTAATNVWGKKIGKADFFPCALDKDKARIGEGYISVTWLSGNNSKAWKQINVVTRFQQDIPPGNIATLNLNGAVVVSLDFAA